MMLPEMRLWSKLNLSTTRVGDNAATLYFCFFSHLCVHVFLPREFNSLAAVQAWRSQPGPPETAGAPEAAGAGEGGTAEAAAGESSGMQVG